MLQVLIGREVETTAPFSDLRFLDWEHRKDININITSQFEPYLLILIAGVALILWVVSYYRLKEKQI